MVIFWVLTVCGGVIRQYGNFYQNYNNFSKIVFSVYNFVVLSNSKICHDQLIGNILTLEIFLFYADSFLAISPIYKNYY